MKSGRRDFLKSAMAVTAAAVSVSPAKAFAAAQQNKETPDQRCVGMLFDATRCIGCMACMSACKESNGLPPEHSRKGNLYDDPMDLSATTQNIIKSTGGENPVFVKRQCMHCKEPACVSVCMLGALHKSEGGVVAYDADRCVGCRYCQIACAFNIPKFEWDKVAPKIVKCQLCSHRLVEGQQPACCEACPRGAVIFGHRHELMKEARQRIKGNPNLYINHIYGEHEAGGTLVLYLSSIPFTELGLPDLPDEPVPELSETVQHGIYKGFAAPVLLYGALAGVLVRHRKNGAFREGVDEDEGANNVS
jgi:formate dehydrogenase iron-sulfur subunit